MRLSDFLKQLFYVRLRLVIAVLAGVVVFFCLPSSLSLSGRIVIGWNALAWLYLLDLWWLMMRADNTRLRQIARLQDESASMVLGIVSMSSLASLLVITFELATAKQLTGADKIFHLGLTGTTLVVSWLLLPTVFAMHYAHLFYRAAPKEKPLIFPDNFTEPSYWDFLYFSFTIGVASQTADVSVGTSSVRKAVLFQSILSFIFNLAILGLCINVGAGLLG